MLASLKIIVLSSQAIPTISTENHPPIFLHPKPRPLATGFVPPIQKRTSSRHSNLSFLPATIFYPEEDEGTKVDHELPSSPHFSALHAQREHLALKLSHPSNSRTLAHLASAYCPPGHSIPLRRIHRVRCVSLDSTHLEIETVLCDDAECASLLVPVPFPVECSRTNDAAAFEECVMDNVHALDREGERRKIVNEEAFSEPPRDGLAHEKLPSAIDGSVREKSTGMFPEWWIPPRMEETWDCDLLRDALNGEDMGSVRMDLIRRRRPALLPRIDEGDVHRAVKVLAIGPRGMMLEVAAMDGKEGIREALALDTVAIQFSSEGNRSIRDEVLRLVASVSRK